MTTSEPSREERQAPGRQVRTTKRVGWLRRQFADVTLVARRDKRWWLLPLIFILLFLAALMVIATTLGPLAPFVYPFL